MPGFQNVLKKHMQWIPLTGLLMMAPAAAFAVDGVIEINAISADTGDITAGDSAGFPVTLSEPGSYRLTGNLSPGSSNHGIEITASGVTIDLNGFSIIGNGSGSSHGIFAQTAAERVTVTNGHVANMGSRGVWLFGPGSQVIGVKSFDNGFIGIQMGQQALVADSVAKGNGSIGILVSDGGVVRNSAAHDNGDDGIQGGHACVIVDNTSVSNDGDGIFGITGCLFKGNTSRFNQDLGLRMVGACGYTQNVFTANIDGDVTGGTQIGDNVCNNGAVCP